MAQLEQRYKGAQRELHPDKFGQRSSQEQQYSADHSAQVNMAYNTLRSPLSRAVYMVSPSSEWLCYACWASPFTVIGTLP